MADISNTSWTEVDSGNSLTPPLGWQPGMFANAVEPVGQANMGAVKRFWNRINPVYLATLTTTDTYAVTETQALAGYGLYELRRTRFPAANVSTSATVNHSALGAIFLRKYNASGSVVNIASGDIQAKDHEYWWDGTQMIVTNPASVVLGTTNKATPTSSDSIVIADAAAAGAQKQALFSALPVPYPSKATPTSSDSIVLSDAAAAGAGKTALISSIIKAPTTQIFTSTSGTYTTPSGALWLRVRLAGAGAGGGGSGSSGQGNGVNGTQTTFGTSLLTAPGGNGGGTPAGGAASTAPTVNSPATSILAISSAAGGVGGLSAIGSVQGSSGSGTSGPLGVGGGGGSAGQGFGAGGGGGTAGAPSQNTPGGGSGGSYIEAIIVGPAASYPYGIGVAGGGGTAGVSGNAGGTGTAGVIIVEEYYV